MPWPRPSANLPPSAKLTLNVLPSQMSPVAVSYPAAALISRASGVVVGVLEAGELDAALDPFELPVHDEVDDPADRVGAIRRRGAAGQDVDPLHERGRNEVEVGAGAEDVARRHPAAVDQDHRAHLAEVAQVDGCGAGRAVGDDRVCDANTWGSAVSMSSMRVTPR